jgi:lipopolysaccharide biosynthesis glycosyltransferase
LNNKIHIALATDDNYVYFALIVLTSIVLNHSDGTPIVVHILTGGLQAEQASRFEVFSKYGMEIDILTIDIDRFSKRWNTARPTYFRLELPELLPTVSRVIYLDCDVVVLDEISKLWKLDLHGHPLGAIGDRVGLDPARNMNLPPERYFNAGVLLLDLERMREQNAVEKCNDLWIRHRSEIKVADQGLLNKCFCDDMELLPQKWNIINSVYRNPPVPGMYTAEEVTEAIRHPGIVHFTGAHKPWLLLKRFHHPYAYTFCQYARRAPIPRSKKIKYWLKQYLNGFFIDSKKQRPWKRSDIVKFPMPPELE